MEEVVDGVGGGAAYGGLERLLEYEAAVGSAMAGAAGEELGCEGRCEDGVNVVDGGGRANAAERGEDEGDKVTP